MAAECLMDEDTKRRKEEVMEEDEKENSKKDEKIGEYLKKNEKNEKNEELKKYKLVPHEEDGGVEGKDEGVEGKDEGVEGKDEGVEGKDEGLEGKDGGVERKDGGVRDGGRVDGGRSVVKFASPLVIDENKETMGGMKSSPVTNILAVSPMEEGADSEVSGGHEKKQLNHKKVNPSTRKEDAGGAGGGVGVKGRGGKEGAVVKSAMGVFVLPVVGEGEQAEEDEDRQLLEPNQMIVAILKLLQLLCENHNCKLQVELFVLCFSHF